MRLHKATPARQRRVNTQQFTTQHLSLSVASGLCRTEPESRAFPGGIRSIPGGSATVARCQRAVAETGARLPDRGKFLENWGEMRDFASQSGRGGCCYSSQACSLNRLFVTTWE